MPQALYVAMQIDFNFKRRIMTDLEKIKKVFDEINLEYNLEIDDNFDYCENEFGERDFVCADMHITDKRVRYSPYNPCTFLFNNDTGKLIAIETV